VSRSTFARAITRNAQANHEPKNVFQTYGLGDSYAPPITLREYAIAGQLDLIAADPSAATPDMINQAKAPRLLVSPATSRRALRNTPWE
jgi:hypothetical protein